MKTLKEVCTELDVSRRAIQGYEEAGLVKAARKNKYGHLLYSQRERERIRRIKFFQDMGFTLRDINLLIDAPKEILKPRLEEQIRQLSQEIDKKEQTIRMAKVLLRELDK